MRSRPKRGGCRVKDLASCFYPRRISLEQERAISYSKQPPIPFTTISSSHKTTVNGEAEPRFAEEDYIVFCFGEDGEILMMNNGKSSQAYRQHRRKCDQGEGMNHATKMGSFRSSDSNPSDSSTSSFTFPVLGMEWIGSPDHMPNTEKCNVPSRRCSRF